MLAAVLLLGGFPVCFGQEIEPSSPATFAEEQEYVAAQTLYRDSCYQLAGEQFESFVAAYPKSMRLADAVFLRAECLFYTSQYRQAAVKFADFVRMFPSSRLLPDAHCRIGQIELLLNKPAEAISDLKTVLDVYGDSRVAGEAAYWIGESYLRIEDTQNALKYYTLAYENYPGDRLRAEALYSIARTYRKRSEFSKASEWFEKLRKEFPRSPLVVEVGISIGVSHFFAGDYRRALAELQQSRRRARDAEDMAEVDYLIAEAFFKLGNEDEARRRYEQFLVDYPGHRLAPEVRYDLGWIYTENADYSKSLACFNALVGRTDELGQAALYQRSVAERFSGNKEAALKSMSEAIDRNSNSKWAAYACYDAGALLFDEGRIAEAESRFRRATVGGIKSDVLPEGYFMLGECLLEEGDYEGAHACFDKASAVPEVPFDTKLRASYLSALCLWRMKSYKEVETRCSIFVSTYPRHPMAVEARYLQADAQYELGEYATAFEAYHDIASSSGAAHREESLYGEAWSMLKLGFAARAIESFEKLIALYPGTRFALDARLRIADAYFFLKDYKKAVESYRSVIRLFPDSLSIDYAYYRLGLSSLEDGDNSGAFHAFQELVGTRPESRTADVAQFALGWIDFRQKEFGEAIKELQKLLKEYPRSDLAPAAHYILGDCFYNTKQYSAAEQSYRAVVQRFPQSPYSGKAANDINKCLAARQKKRITTKTAVESIDTDVPFPAVDRAQRQPERLLQEDTVILSRWIRKAAPIRSSRERETVEVMIKDQSTTEILNRSKYSGLAQAGMGTYFSPLVKFQFGQVLPNFHYALRGDYHLTKGFVRYTDQSGGGFSAAGGTTLPSALPIFQNAVADGKLEFENESYHLYGSIRPDFWREVTDFGLQTTLVNQLTAPVPYSVNLSVRNLDVQDTSTLARETQLALRSTADFALSMMPIRTEMDIVTASRGIWFSNLSVGSRYRWLEEIEIQGSLHLYWASGMAGQSLARVRPHISVSYRLHDRHKAYIAYEPSVLPVTLAARLRENRYLSSSAALRHKDVTDSGEFGIESDWSDRLRSRCIFNVQSLRDDAFFSPVPLQPGWELVYGGRTTIVTARAEMFAKLTLNDYFGSSLLLRSAKDSFLGERIPNFPSIEAGCYAHHRLGSKATIAAHVRIIGNRYGDAGSGDKIPAFMVVNVTGDYMPVDFLKLSAAILNLTDAKYSLWRGYREFPLTVHFAAQVSW